MSAGITMTSEAVKIPGAGSDSPKRPKKSLWTGGIVTGALWDSVEETKSAHADEESGDVRGGSGRSGDDCGFGAGDSAPLE